MFEPARSLLNPKFEGYKLDALDQDQVIARFPLQYKPSQSTLSGRIPLSFEEVQSRIRHNHLTVGPAGKAIYVDAEFRVVSISVNEATLVPTYEVVYELPRPIETEGQDLPQREYPSASFVGADNLLVSDGFGSLYALKLVQRGPAQALNVFELVIPDVYSSAARTVPFRLHLAEQVSPGNVLVVLSSKHYPVEAEQLTSGSTQNRKTAHVRFDVWAVKVDLSLPTQDQPLPLEILWHRRGNDVPQLLAHDTTRKAVILLGSCPYRTIEAPAPVTYEPSSDEIAPIPRAGENLDGASGDAAEAPPPNLPPYSWTQTTDTVTVAFALPSSTPKSAIRVTFSPRTLTVLVGIDSPSPGVPIPKYTAKALWDGIQPSTSFWTWDKEDSGSFGMLSLHLDKQHEGTRWLQVFAKAGTQPSSAPSTSPDDVEVPETMDPTELYAIRESLEKWTATLQSGGNGAGGIPSLAEGEMDEEIDSEMGKWSFVTWVGEDGSEPSWANDRGMDAPLSVLSTSFPGLATPLPSIVVKNGMDGVLFKLQPGSSPAEPPTWNHTSTFSVLSFVLASKRDTRFVHHVSSKAVLAFESGSRGNVYLYRNTAGVHDQWAKQAVLKIASGSAGSLLGVGILKTSQGRQLILSLCEGELVIAHDVL